MAKAIISSDGMGEATEGEFEAYVSFVCERIDDRCGFEVDVESLPYGQTGDRIIADGSERDTISEVLLNLYEEWSATGGNEYVAGRLGV